MIGRWFRKSAPADPEPVRRAPPMLLARGPRRGATGARMFDAANSDRLTSGWTSTPMPADQIIRRNWRVLVARSREQLVNNGYAKNFQRSCRRNIVGQKGFILQSRAVDSNGEFDTVANKAIEAAFKKWSHAKNCDVKGRRSFLQIQKTVVNALPTDGEFMVRMVTGRNAGPWGFALQMLDPVNCPVDFDEDRRPNGRFIRAGIEYTAMGRAVNYYFHTLDAAQADYSYAGRAYIKVPADQIIHWFEEDLVGQKRGIPWLATSLLRMRQLDQFERAALTNAREGANKLGVIEWDEGFGPEDDEEGEEGPGEIVLESEEGVFHEMARGARLKKVDSAFPNGEMAQFAKHNLRGVASGLGAAYNDLANDLEGVNLSSIRHGMIAERDRWKELQESLIEGFALIVHEHWLRHALLAKKIVLPSGAALPASKLATYSQATFQARRWDWQDPSKDVKADAEAVNNMFKSRGQVIRERGRDPRDVYEEIAADIRDMQAAGIPQRLIDQLILKKEKGAPADGTAAQSDPDATETGNGSKDPD